MLRLLATLALLGIPSLAQALSAERAADLFDAIRADLPCLANSEKIVGQFGLRATGNDENTNEIKLVEFGSRDGKSFVLVSRERRKGKPQNAVSVSVYDTNEDFPPELTSAFAEIWGLPVPKPLRTDPKRAQFHWSVSFPNGPMQVIIGFNPESGLTQIYGRTLDLTEEQINVCSR